MPNFKHYVHMAKYLKNRIRKKYDNKKIIKKCSKYTKLISNK